MPRTEENSASDLVVVECGGASIVDHRPCFDHTNKFMFCCCGRYVRVILVENGERVRSLCHASEVVDVVLDEENMSHVLTCTSDGIISQWNYENGLKVREWTVPDEMTVHCFIIPERAPATWFIVAAGRKEAQLFSLSRTRDGLSKRIVTDVPDDCRKVSIHKKGHFVAYAVGRKLWIKGLLQEHESPRSLAVPGKSVSLVVCHPTKDSVATGDELGRILVWHKVLGHRPVYTIYHWHSLPVRDITFSNEGTTMYSGGEEMVVVRWSFQSSSKEETKDFLPRAGSKIRFLASSPDSSIVGVSLEDNSIQIASSQLKVVASVQGFVRNVGHSSSVRANDEDSEYQQQPCFPVGLIVSYDGVGCGGGVTEPCLVTNGRPGYLQFYDGKKGKIRTTLDVVGKNQPPAERGRRLSYFEVVHVALCDRWLATVDHRPDPQYSDETNLKFWEYDIQSESFKLSTWIDRPHSGSVTSLFFRPPQDTSTDNPTLISTGHDGKFKIWELSTDINIYNSRECWTCERVGFYRSLPATCGDVSSEGDVGIGFANTLTMWDFDDHRMTMAKSVLPTDHFIRKLQFGATKEEKHLVAVLSDIDLAAWNVFSQLCLWRVTTRPDLICKDIASGLFAAFFGSKVCLFRLPSPEPTHVVTSNDFERAIAATFANDSTAQESENTINLSRLYFITDTQNLMCLKRAEEKEKADDEEVPVSSVTDAKTPFARLLAEGKASKQNKTSRHIANYETNMQLLSGPAHALPSVETIGPIFAESCLAKKGTWREEGEIVFPDVTSEITFESLKALYS